MKIVEDENGSRIDGGLSRRRCIADVMKGDKNERRWSKGEGRKLKGANQMDGMWMGWRQRM